jgi:hypothetical protein
MTTDAAEAAVTSRIIPAGAGLEKRYDRVDEVTDEETTVVDRECARNSRAGAPMRAEVAHLSQSELIDLAAYAASLKP